ncbi:ABC transporter ATP-binding protein [Granulosicoccus antarcticus]|uniref:Ferric enterobactin transport ATP-binding protein FepC n=1 Tax=Granulosicoccus antarcticus IMCC3135 TaxID=1192854 RepID=A0A2Z2NJL2_9GAMM|nr:ATP-binding cassette domain-containing protein [Granulosicoccus antarcticus]ASJ71582.1 Ferric enterobactin transport ATP-binding protein FepC [Granulosicoccus antarcticus IMCC3135]
MIKTRAIDLSLDKHQILRDISVELPPGKITALIGPNGAGKSSLLHTLSRLQKQDRGEVELAGRLLNDYAFDELARHLSVLRQHSSIGSRLRVRELVAFGRYPHNKGRGSKADDVIIEQALADFDLSSLSDRFLETLSGGQRQRALLAMNFAQATDMVLLDEPLNNLDIRHARQLMQLIRLHVDKGRTFALVLHDLNHAARHADYIVAMKNGEIFMAGDTAAVLNSEVLSALYETDIRMVTVEGSLLALTY